MKESAMQQNQDVRNNKEKNNRNPFVHALHYVFVRLRCLSLGNCSAIGIFLVTKKTKQQASSKSEREKLSFEFER